MSQYLVVHKYGSNNPFLYGDIWGPDRSKSRKFVDRSAAEAAAKSSQEMHHLNRPGAVVVDEVEHPEVQAALVALMVGDKSNISVLKAYKDKVGFPSLLHFAEIALHEHYYQLFKKWGIV